MKKAVCLLDQHPEIHKIISEIQTKQILASQEVKYLQNEAKKVLERSEQQAKFLWKDLKIALVKHNIREAPEHIGYVIDMESNVLYELSGDPEEHRDFLEKLKDLFS